MKRLGFRSRLFLILALFAFVPSIVLTMAWGGSMALLLPLMSSTAAWDSVAASGSKALAVARRAPHTAAEEKSLATHEQRLENSVTNARRFSLLARTLAPPVFVAVVIGFILLSFGTSRVAGHLSRQLSRPLHELVGWTESIRLGAALPPAAEARGAPEFGVLRSGMRQMAAALETGRKAAIEAERLAAFRESARQVAHELKNPLTPIRFAVERLVRSKQEIPPELFEAVEVLASESKRLESMARSFAQFGRLPDSPPSDVDVGDLVRAAARAAVPPGLPFTIEVADELPMLHAQHDALSRAVTNVLLNAVEACDGRGAISARVWLSQEMSPAAIVIAVRDTGIGIAPERLGSIWEPYTTDKTGGTGLGLAIVKQTVLALGGRVEADSALGYGCEIRLILPAPVYPQREA